MKFRDRIRKTIKWSALCALALLIAVWGFNRWFSVHVSRPDVGIEAAIEDGRITAVFWDRELAKAFHRKTYCTINREYHQTFEDLMAGDPAIAWDILVPGKFKCRIPLWWGMPPLAAIWFFAWRPDRTSALRARTGHCVKCGYHRAGLKPESPCPECGVSEREEKAR